jgi:hypothetical protein
MKLINLLNSIIIKHLISISKSIKTVIIFVIFI